MKKMLLFMAVALLASFGVYAQEEGGDETEPIVHTKSFLSVIEDAKFLVTCPAYTTGQESLQSAIGVAERELDGFTDDTAVRETLKTLQTAIDAFIEANAPVNATEKVQNPSFTADATNATTITGWVTTNFKENARTPGNPSTSTGVISQFTEQWVNATQLTGSGDMHQEVSKLPAGHYRLTADVFVISQKTDTLTEAVGVQLYFNDQLREIGLTDVLSGVNAVNFGLDCDIDEGGTLTIGLRFENVNVNWLGWDNITLYYVGDQEAYDAIVNAEKLAAARETLQAAIDAAQAALDSENAPYYRDELKGAIETATSYMESTSLDDVNNAVTDLNDVLAYFNGYNRYYTNLLTAIQAAEALLAEGTLTEGADEFRQAIADARTDMQEAITTYLSSPEEGVILLQDALTALQRAEATYRVRNASYSNPANVITNGSMASTDGWDILVPGANPGLHINTSGTVTNFSKPFMECWVNNTDYGQQNYARQIVNMLPDGQPLPRGYYVLKAAALATRQDQAGLEVSGVTLQLQDQQVAVHTANGVAQFYTLGYEKAEDGGELTFGLFIDETTDANWIAWDEVKLQFVGPKDKYLEEYAEATLGEIMNQLKEAVADGQALIESVDANGIDITGTDLYSKLDEADYIIENPMETTMEEIEQLLKDLEVAKADFYRSGVSPKTGQAFDFSEILVNPNFDTAPVEGLNGEGWTAVSGVLPSGEDCTYWWFGGSTGLNLVQDFQQTIYDMPAGNYLLDVNAAIRVDMTFAPDGYTEEKLPSNMTSCQIYANTDSADVHPFFYIDEEKGLTLESMMAMTNDYDYRHGNGTLIDYMLKESGLFNSYIAFTLEEKGEITVGFRVELPKLGGQMPFVDYFRLLYYGNQDITGVAVPKAEATSAKAGVYDLMGRRVAKPQHGLYIVNGRKVVIR